MEENNLNQGSSPENKDRRRKKFYYKFKRKNFSAQGGTNALVYKKISIVIPLLNEEDSLKPLVYELKKVFFELKNIEYEIIFIDDGSTDKSFDVIKELSRENQRIKYIQFQKNYGKSAALSVGFKYATGDVIITMDADLQDDPKEIPNLLKKIQEGYYLVSGWKKVRYDPIIKRISSKFYNFVTSVFTGIKIHDFNCGLKAYRKEVVKSIKVYGEMHRYLPVLAHWNGYKVGEIPVQHHPRRYGKTKFGASRFIKGYLDLITIIFTTRYLKRPLHFFGTMGTLTFLIGFALSLYLTIEWMFFQQPLSNRPILFLAVLLMILGVQFFSIGLIGEMIVHYSQTPEDYQVKTIQI